MEKVTLTKEQAEAIEFALNTKRLAYFQSPEALLQSHIRSRHFLDDYYEACEIKAKAIVQHTLECLDITVKGIND